MEGALELARTLTDGRLGHRQLDWSQLRYQHTQALRAVLAERYSAATVNKILAAVRGVLKEAWRLGAMAAEDYHRATDLPGVRGERLPRGRALTSGELRALFATCSADPTSAGRRDAAIMAILYGAGLRRSELVGLDLADYDHETGALTVRGGKGNKDRFAYSAEGSREALQAWLAVRGLDAGPLFGPVNKAGRLTPGRLDHGRLTGQAVMYILRRRAEEAGVRRFSPHDLRRTFISDLLDAGADISTVQHLAGHSQVTTTQRYDRRPEEGKRKAAKLLHVPFEGAA